MTKTVLNSLAEEELDTLVSIAIRRAEILEDAQSPAAHDAWHEVMLYESRLAAITAPSDIPGGVARVGAVWSALAAGERAEAESLAARYLAEESLPRERRQAIDCVLAEDRQRLADHYPALAKRGRLAELSDWRQRSSKGPLVFPRAA
jgi:hypothetical protein